MKFFTYLALLGLASCFDADTAYDVVTDPETSYIRLNPKGENSHEETLIYLHGGNGSAKGEYYYVLKNLQIAPLTTKIVIVQAPQPGGD